MRIEHVAVWTRNLDRLRDFYVRNFGCSSGDKYTNAAKGFSSYMLCFESGARLELMSRTDVTERTSQSPQVGYAHFALALGSEEAVRQWTEKLRKAGVPVASEPRRTGDGYYESAVLDPDGNTVELTV
ncbi:glyoxalase/bleomycin resistance/extradiol dioxygenase family protein [Opitutaceae bacterium EW11]|nr:glyoxalase/bleomycin resistance/extradiol dioxygenase family protein [Opitutaceae bacterium EW11]